MFRLFCFSNQKIIYIVGIQLHQSKSNFMKILLGTVLTVLLASNAYSQDIYYKGSKVGEIQSDGDVYVNGREVGEIQSDGDIYKNGSEIGEIQSDGDIYYKGSEIGEIQSDGDVYYRGSEVGEIQSDGDVYYRGSQIGTARGVKPEHAAVFFFFFVDVYMN